MKNNKIDIVADNYLVAFIDILGQRNELKKFSILPKQTDVELMREFKSHIEHTVILAHGFHESFKRYFDAFIENEKKSPYSHVMTINEIKFQRLTDGIIIYTSLRADVNKVPVMGIMGIIQACGLIFLNFLSKGKPLRGGIDVGWGVEINESELYGAAAYKAYSLETNVAQYPRIVIGGETINYLRTLVQQQSDMHGKVESQIAERCLNLLVLDDDGQLIIDYLGDAFIQQAYGGNAEQIIKDSYRFILEASSTFKAQKDTKLAFRYSLLRDYFEAKLPIDWC